MRTGIALGSNVGDRARHLRAARVAVLAMPCVQLPIHTSCIYATSPVGCPPGTGPFLNAVMEFEFAGEPLELLAALRACERALGRAESLERNAPRAIDLDLLYIGDVVLKTPDLILPHPRMAQRRFVLGPLAEIHPDLVLPGQQRNAAELLAQLPSGDTAEALDLAW